MLLKYRNMALFIATLLACLAGISLGDRGRAVVTRKVSVSRTTSDLTGLTVEQSLQMIMTKLDQHHSQLETTMRDVMRVSRRTQREVADLQKDMELILGNVYKPSCHEIAQDQHDAAPGRTNDASIAVFVIKPPKFETTEVRCEIERGGVGWTVMLSRTSGRELFNRTYKEYQDGFGDPNGDYYIGNDVLHKLTSWKPHQLRVVMEDWDGQKTWVQYNRFSVAGASDGYRLTVEQFEADSAAGDGLETHNGMLFSAMDKDQDNNPDRNCARGFGGGGGWWYNDCYNVLPTGKYRSTGGAQFGGVAWYPWRNRKHSLRSLTMLLGRNGP